MFKYEVVTEFANGDIIVRPFKIGLFAEIHATRMRRKKGVEEVQICASFKQKGEYYGTSDLFSEL